MQLKYSLNSYLSLIQSKPMLSNNSQLEQEQNDNQFLPNRSNSYESIVKQHTQRRSLILNDPHLLPSYLQSHPNQQSRRSGLIPSAHNSFLGHSEQKGGHLESKSQEQNQENQFLMNEKSLADSIKHVLKMQDSKIQSSKLKNHHFTHREVSQQNGIQSQNAEQELFSNLNKQSQSHHQHLEWNQMNNSKSNAQDSFLGEQPSRQNQQPKLVFQNSIESDPFENASHHNKSLKEGSHIEDQPFPNHQQKIQNSNFMNQLSNPSHPNQSNEDEVNRSNQAALMNASFSKHQDIQLQHKSRSQIEAIYSNLQSNLQEQRSSAKQSPKINSQSLLKQSTSKQNIEFENHSHEQHQVQSNRNSLSKLMKQNYFGHQYNNSIKQIQSFERSNNQLQSQVQILKQQPSINQLSKQQQSRFEDPLASIANISQAIAHQNIQSGSASQQKHINSQQNNQNSGQNYYRPSNSRLSHKSSRSIIEKYNNSLLVPNQSAENNRLQHIDPSASSKNFLQHENFHQNSKQSIIDFIEQLSSKHNIHQRQQDYADELSEPEQLESNLRQHQPQQKPLESSLKNHSISNHSQSPIQNKSKNGFSQQQQSHYNMPSIQSSSFKKSSLRQDKGYSSVLQQRQSIQNQSKNASKYYLPQIDNKSKKSQISHGNISKLSKKNPSLLVQNNIRLSQASSKQNSSNLKKSNIKLQHSRQKMVSYSEGVEYEGTFQHFGSTTVDSKSTILKKKSQTAKEIFNTFPQVAQQPSNSVLSDQGSKIKLSMEPIMQDKQQEKAIVKSPNKEREDQIQRMKILKQAQKKRLQRQLQKVKKQLEQINSREKNMQRIYEEKQKIQLKDREHGTSHKDPKIYRNNRENEAIMKIIKEHRKSKEQELKADDFQENINKNLMELSAIRKEAEEKMREKKKLQIIQRMKKNEMRKINNEKLSNANKQYIQQFRSADMPIKSPQKIQSRVQKKTSRDLVINSKAKLLKDIKLKEYQQKLD